MTECCAVPGCENEVALVKFDLDGGADNLCAIHAREDLETIARFGDEEARGAARRLLEEPEEPLL